MQHDEVIWQVIRHNHCSFMAKITTGNFCRNPYNVTGTCNRSSCPLANSRYATIRDHEGVFYLYMKTIERAHMPNKLWERVKLPRNYEKALEIIDKHLVLKISLVLAFLQGFKLPLTNSFVYSEFNLHLGKFQFHLGICIDKLRTLQYVVVVLYELKWFVETWHLNYRTHSILYHLNVLSPIMITFHYVAYAVEIIEKEILERLKKGVYGDIYNYPIDAYNNVLDKVELLASEDEQEEEYVAEYVQAYEQFEEEDDMEDFGGLSIGKSHIDVNNGMDDEEEDEEAVAVDRKRLKRDSKHEKDKSVARKKKPRVLVEVRLSVKIWMKDRWQSNETLWLISFTFFASVNQMTAINFEASLVVAWLGGKCCSRECSILEFVIVVLVQSLSYSILALFLIYFLVTMH
ncbi:hypothetical protein RHMOL_Rhmol01G0121600 [Rhododendron molle]|uniref:Uncharacterized protein n=3 Tax=Rhododendron molle TaxID=49168 RepID=A0ACC0Q0A8_RHOML|nr:hypothetical protein RHMOL_Rhmol01G0121600 [Rhododendron molle]KAI8571460.1 hypothetical protein RHMOL_Rhmol01G0121600 [Rhododendron molle]KAI8571461.1 hypothetical protein RHMOL_Rhmol01G0121600 [Rhododendron molle]